MTKDIQSFILKPQSKLKIKKIKKTFVAAIDSTNLFNHLQPKHSVEYNESQKSSEENSYCEL